MRYGLLVGRTRSASAAVDLSDGLAAGVRLLAEASGTGATVDAEQVPIHPGVREIAGDVERTALEGGEDYELLFAVPPRRRRAFLAAVTRAGKVPVTRIGRLTKSGGCWLVRVDSRTELGSGYSHF